MSKRFLLSSVLSLSVVALIAITASPAFAVKEFKDAFKSKYVKPDSTAANDVALAAAVDQTSCGICHTDPKNKKLRNDYGKQLAKLITKKDKKNKDKIFKAMDKVAAMKVKPADAKSPTFGDKIAKGMLPMQE
jgi:mono/diheme cytochrome c family protein